jgi:hypothetical protein
MHMVGQKPLSMSRIQKATVGGVVVLILLPLVIATYYRGFQHYTLADSLYSGFLGWMTDTSWAKGYSERNFAKVTVGMTEDEVRRIMGDPVWKPSSNYWGYTWSPSSTHYHQRALVFSPSGSVTQIVRGFYFD